MKWRHRDAEALLHLGIPRHGSLFLLKFQSTSAGVYNGAELNMAKSIRRIILERFSEETRHRFRRRLAHNWRGAQYVMTRARFGAHLK
jgi:hypothetical protein